MLDDSNVRVERDPDGWLDAIDAIKASATSDVYLCGGGRFAGYLLEHGRINALVIKLAPVVLGGGTPIFGGAAPPVTMTPVTATRHDSGVLTLRWEVGAADRDRG